MAIETAMSEIDLFIFLKCFSERRAGEEILASKFASMDQFGWFMDHDILCMLASGFFGDGIGLTSVLSPA